MYLAQDMAAGPSALVSVPPAPGSTASSSSSSSASSSSSNNDRRSNRRRQRPGSRKRRALATKQALAFEMSEGLHLAHDDYVKLPANTTGQSSYPSQHSRLQSAQAARYEQSWVRWKEREEAEERAVLMLAGNDVAASHYRYQPAALGAAAARCKMFGGDVGDDAWRSHLADISTDDIAQLDRSESFPTLGEFRLMCSEALDSGARLLAVNDDEYDYDTDDEDNNENGNDITYQLPLAMSMKLLSSDDQIQRYLSSTVSIHRSPQFDISTDIPSDADSDGAPISDQATQGLANEFCPSEPTVQPKLLDPTSNEINESHISPPEASFHISIVIPAPKIQHQGDSNPSTPESVLTNTCSQQSLNLGKSPIFELASIPSSPTIIISPSACASMDESLPSLQSLPSTCSSDSSTSTITREDNIQIRPRVPDNEPPSWTLIPSPPAAVRDSWIFLSDDL